MSERVVCFNGQFVPEAEARVSIYDSALNFGDMAFEVTRTYHQRPFRLRDHLRRLFHSLGAMQIDPGISIDELEGLTDETLGRNLPTEAADVDWNVIHNVSRGPASGFFAAFTPEELRPTVVISCFPLLTKMAGLAPAYVTGLDLVVPAQSALPHELLDTSIKNRSRWHYQLANLQAQSLRPGASAVLVDPDGFLTEGTSANLFLVRGGELQTPEARNLLPGITRGVVLELASRLDLPSAEKNLTPADALLAEEIFVTSTSIGVLHVRSFQGQTVGDGKLGPITARVRHALEAEVGMDFAAQAESYALRRAETSAKSRR
jgi:branched-chain amino acid aminotransferase